VTRPADAVRALALGATAAAGLLREDPLLLVLQASRRLPAAGTRGVTTLLLAGRPAGHVREVAGHWLAGHRDPAVTALASVRPRGSLQRRLLRTLTVELEAVPAGALPPGVLRARALWRAGAPTAAVAAARAAGRRRAADRYAAELETLRPGFAVPAPKAPARTGPRPPSSPSTPPRALHLLTSSLPHTASGYALRSHAVLRGQQAAGVEVVAATRLGYPVSVGRFLPPRRDRVDGVLYERLLPARMPGTAVQRAGRTVDLLLALARDVRPTVVHTTTPCGNGQVARAVAAAIGVPWVYEVRGLLEQTWVADRPDPAARLRAAGSERVALLQAQEAAVASAAAHVVTLSETLRADLVARGVPPDRVSVVPNGVDARLLTLPDPTPARARTELGLPPGGFWVGTVSSLVDYEGLHTLVDAVALLRAQGLDVRACLVGDGVARPALARRAAEAGVAGAVVLPGRVPRDRAVRWHRALDVFVVPRRDLAVCRGVTPMKPVEAMALGRPVIGSDLPALAEVLGGAGVLVPPEDASALAGAVADLLEDPARRRSMVAAGREVAAGRTWEQQGRRYHALYERLREEVAA
jgi:glycosyltransferase involved in cell wall biosynthesis